MTVKRRPTITQFMSTYTRMTDLATAARSLAHNLDKTNEEVVMKESRRIHDEELIPMLASINLDELIAQYQQGLITKAEFVSNVQLPTEAY